MTMILVYVTLRAAFSKTTRPRSYGPIFPPGFRLAALGRITDHLRFAFHVDTLISRSASHADCLRHRARECRPCGCVRAGRRCLRRGARFRG
ncbi:hypothetical protein CA830_33125, partial [Burkholderia multivorans]